MLGKGFVFKIPLTLIEIDECSFEQFIEHVVTKVEFNNTNMGQAILGAKS